METSSTMEATDETSLLQSPSKPRYADRFMPTRSGKSWHMTFEETPNKQQQKTNDDHGHVTPKSKGKSESEEMTEERTTPYSCLLKNEVLGYDYDSASTLSTPSRKNVNRKLFHYDNGERPLKNFNSDPFSPYASSPVSGNSQKLIRTPLRRRRRISKTPYKILDAPELADDYYLNLLDWSSQDILCVGLGTNVYTWTASTCNVGVLMDLSEQHDLPTSVRWNEKGNLVALGTHSGVIKVWDIEAEKLVLERPSHTSRIGVLDWNVNTILSGSRDRRINMIDCRTPSPCETTVGHHEQEICGLRWSSFNSMVASGGNDNAVYLWNLHSPKPVLTLKEHTAAVKAICWSPHERHILTSGGGTSDRCIKFWNTLTGTCIESVNTESQVCNVAWSPHSKELVSTHGYAHNNVAVWKYPAMTLVACLKGHTQRVLYMTMSPDGKSVCTGASDETLRFWNVFEPNHCRVKKSPLDLFKGIR